jgi:hypothetical protein
MKYYFITLEILDGEHGYFSHSVYCSETMTLKEVEDEVARTWYDYEEEEDEVELEMATKTFGPRKEDGSWYFPVEQVYVQVYRSTEISKEHYDILNQYI